jgi:hypothetical protein
MHTLSPMWTLLAPLALALACAHQPDAAAAAASSAQAPAAPPPARPADVASPDAIIAAAYDVISGAKGEPRDWNRFRSLFLPGARLIPTMPKEPGPGFSAIVLTTEEFVTRATAHFDTQGFYEKGTARRLEQYGDIAQAFGTYESRHAPSEEPFTRGINSFQLFFDGSRWWLVTILWWAETPETPIPKEFLPGGH